MKSLADLQRCWVWWCMQKYLSHVSQQNVVQTITILMRFLFSPNACWCHHFPRRMIYMCPALHHSGDSESHQIRTDEHKLAWLLWPTCSDISPSTYMFQDSMYPVLWHMPYSILIKAFYNLYYSSFSVVSKKNIRNGIIKRVESIDENISNISISLMLCWQFTFFSPLTIRYSLQLNVCTLQDMLLKKCFCLWIITVYPLSKWLNIFSCHVSSSGLLIQHWIYVHVCVYEIEGLLTKIFISCLWTTEVDDKET